MIVLEMMVDLSPLYISLKTAIITIIITFFLGLFLAKWTLNRKHDLTKNILRVMYHTRMGDFIWTKFNQFMHRPFIWNKLHEGEWGESFSNQLQCMDFDTGIFELEIVENENNLLTIDTLNLVFTRENGVYSGTDITRYPFKIIHYELGIKKCRFYDLRGSYATKILKNGIEIRDVADLLGHRNIETTENYYISSSVESRKEANDVFESVTHSEIISKISNYSY